MAGNNSGPASMEASLASLNSVDHDTSATSSANMDTQNSKWTSANTSPLASRDSSPTRQFAKMGRITRSSTAGSGTRSRKNSTQDLSPTRTKSNIPTPTATPRQQISPATTPSLPPPSRSEPTIRAPVPQKLSHLAETSKDNPRWPVSPRLKSPPPALNKPAIPGSRAGDADPPSISVQRATPSPHVEPPSHSPTDSDAEDHLQAGTKTPSRGPSSGSSTLETVQEVSQPNTPGPGLDAAIDKLAESTTSQSSQIENSTESIAKQSQKGQAGQNSESGSDSGSGKASTRRSSNATAPPPLLHSRQSSTALKFGPRAQASGESSSRNMTVETEEVTNMQKLSLAPNPVAPGVNGSVRTKPSSETIKPKKDKKKQTRKPTSVASGAGKESNVFAFSSPPERIHGEASEHLCPRDQFANL
jgi:hypothetical protein